MGLKFLKFAKSAIQQAQASVGGLGLKRIAKAAPTEKMNGDTSAPAQKQRHGLSARNNGVRRNNMFGN